jgi:hypothetical protein
MYRRRRTRLGQLPRKCKAIQAAVDDYQQEEGRCRFSMPSNHSRYEILNRSGEAAQKELLDEIPAAPSRRAGAIFYLNEESDPDRKTDGSCHCQKSNDVQLQVTAKSAHGGVLPWGRRVSGLFD